LRKGGRLLARFIVGTGIIAAALQALPAAGAEAVPPGAKKPPAAVDRARQQGAGRGDFD
jgi:hypothetical protein